MESLGTDSESTEAIEGVHLAMLAGGEAMNVQRFEIEPGATVPTHSHPHEQAGYLVMGTLTFVLDDEERELRTGDSYVIPGGESHGVENRGEDIVRGIDVFSPPRENPDWAE
ncbi:cupin domain-containing protein [Halococcus sp. AFM35]|uniref:cupin domain-containing protein n=1 Tax=Halococcus sp. AFM35 TaxID=3421653 RepID=UPI003EBFD4B2